MAKPRFISLQRKAQIERYGIRPNQQIVRGVPAFYWPYMGFVITPERLPDHTVRMARVPRQIHTNRVVGRYISHIRKSGLRPSSVHQIGVALRPYRKVFGDRVFIDITQKELSRFLRDEYRSLQSSTYGFYSRALRKFYDWAVQEGYCLYNFVREYRLPVTGKLAYFTPLQLDYIFARVGEGELRDGLLLLYYTGMRQGEMNRIVGADFLRHELVLPRRRIRVPYSLLQVVEKRPYYDALRVRESFCDFMRDKDFPGTLNYVRNAYLVRAYLAGVPVEEISHSMGHSDVRVTEDAISRIEGAGVKWLSEAKRQKYGDFI